MLVRDSDFDYIIDHTGVYGSTKQLRSKAVAVVVKDEKGNECTLSPDSDFGSVRFNRPTVSFILLGKGDKPIWTSMEADAVEEEE